MKTLLSLLVQALPSMIKAFKGMTPKERIITACVGVVGGCVLTILIHFFGYETVTQAVDVLEDVVEALD